MRYLLDTDTCIDLLRGHHAVIARAKEHQPSQLSISAITAYELEYGAIRALQAGQGDEQEKVRLLLTTLRILPFTKETASHAARIRTELESQGTPIGPMDTLIAATALENEHTLITHNLKEFRRIPELQSLSWRP